MSRISNFFKKFINKDLLTVESEGGKLSLFSLAIPLFISAISIHLIAVLQTALASRYADGFFVIPISVSNSLLSVIQYILVMVATGTNILLSIAIGKNDKERCKRLFGTAAILIGVFSIVLLSIACIFAEPLLRLMASGNTEFSIYITASVIYFRIRLIEVCIQVFYTLINNVLQCYGYTKLGLICGITTSLLTFILCWIFLFVVKIPAEYGAQVFGFTAVFSNVVGIIIAISIFIHRKISVSFKFDKSLAKEIFAVGAPASVSMIFYSLSQMITTTICLKLTPDMYLAKTYVVDIVYFVYVFGYSMAQAAATMVGRLCGLNDLDKADKFTKQNYRIVVTLDVMLSALICIFSKPIFSLFFDASETVLAYIAVVMVIDIFVEFGRGMNHIGQFSLNATGDVKFTTVVSIVSCWACSVGLAYVFGILLNLGVYGIWIAFAIDEIFRGTLYFIHWRKGAWKKRFA